MSQHCLLSLAAIGTSVKGSAMIGLGAALYRGMVLALSMMLLIAAARMSHERH